MFYRQQFGASSDRTTLYNVTLRRVRVTTVVVKTTIIITYCECVYVALGIQHALRMTIMSSVACPALQYFSKLPEKGTIF
jgi:hypothetical protein